MGRLVTYDAARRMVDAAIYVVRSQLWHAYSQAWDAAELAMSAREFESVQTREMLSSYVAMCEREVVIAWLTMRSALVGMIKQHRRGPTKNVPVKTRNRRGPKTGKIKTFPRDALEATEHATGEGLRAHFVSNSIPSYRTKSAKGKRDYPLRALLSQPRKGRPPVHPVRQAYMKRKHRARQLDKQKIETASRRNARGWKQYPDRKTFGQGWSDPREVDNGQEQDAQLVEDILAENIAFREGLRDAKYRDWLAAH